MLGCDSLVASGDLALNVMNPARSRVIVNTHEQITGQFARDPDLAFPTESIVGRIRAAAGEGNVQLLDATRIATRLLGDAIASNLFLLGYAYQRGLVPVSGVAIERAIELNGIAVEMNREAFRWGRRAGRDLAAVESLAASGDEGLEPPAPKTLDELVERRVADLTALAERGLGGSRYLSLVERVREAERALGAGGDPLAGAVARFAYKLMAYKDEYEVARLYTDGAFRERLAARFEGDLRVTFHMAPPLLVRPDPVTGEARKRTYGPWMWRVLALVAKMRGLRGTPFDIFGRTAERRTERRLIEEYFETVDELLAGLRPENRALAVEIASVPDRIRGYGHVKARNVAEAEAERAALLERWRTGGDEWPPRRAPPDQDCHGDESRPAWTERASTSSSSRAPSTGCPRTPSCSRVGAWCWCRPCSPSRLNDLNRYFICLAYFPAIAFWILDGYFLRQERLFRRLYDHVRSLEEADVDYSMDASPVRRPRRLRGPGCAGRRRWSSSTAQCSRPSSSSPCSFST